MHILILIDKLDLTKSLAFKSKTQVAEHIGVHRNTIPSIPWQNKHYLLIHTDLIPSNRKGNNPNIK